LRYQPLPPRIQITIDRLASTIRAQNPSRAADFEVFGRNLANLREQGRRGGTQADRAESATTASLRAWARDINRDAASGSPMLNETLASRDDNTQAALRLLRDSRVSFSRLTGNLMNANTAAVQPAVNTAIREAAETRDYIAALTSKINSALANR